MNNLPVIFHRQNIYHLDISEKVLKDFAKQGIAVVHYGFDDKRGHGLIRGKKPLSTNYEDYKDSARNVLKRMQDYCDEGAIVVSQYIGETFREIIIGELKKGSKIEAEYRRIDDENYIKGKTPYKFIRLRNIKKIDGNKLLLLESLLPRGSTFVKWTSNGIDEILRNIYKNDKLPFSLNSLSPTQLEVLCSEYLRDKVPVKSHRINYFLLPIGRSKIGTDIFGSNGVGELILAQVSATSDINNINEKIDILKTYEKKGGNKRIHLIYFGPHLEKNKLNLGNVNYIFIEDVWDSFKNEQILKDMLF